MSRIGYQVTVEHTGDYEKEKGKPPIVVRLTRTEGGNSTRMPVGYYDSPEQAGTVATYIQSALHDEHLRGINESYERCIALVSSSDSGASR